MVELRVARCSVATEAIGSQQTSGLQHGRLSTILNSGKGFLHQATANTLVSMVHHLQVYLNRITLSQPVAGEKTCKYKNKGVEYEIGEGEVTEIKRSKVRVCTGGKTLLVAKEDFPPPWKYACNGEI